MYLKQVIESVDLDDMRQSVGKNDSNTALFQRGLLHREHAISNMKWPAGRTLDRRLLHSWRTKGLLPYEMPVGWGRYNTVELVWLALLLELRALGVGLERLMLLKEYFFSTEEYLHELNVDKYLGNSSKADDLKNTSRRRSYGDLPALEAAIVRTFDAEGASRLLHHIFDVIVNRYNIGLRLTADGKHDFFEFGELQRMSMDASLDETSAWYKLLNDHSCVIVNLTNIIREITQTHDLFTIEQNKISFKRSAESLIRELFNEDDITEITIRLTNKDEPLLMVKRELSYRELHQKINSLQRRGVFRDISIKTRDGHVSYFESIDLIKL